MKMDRKKAIIIAIILLTSTTLAVGAQQGWFRFIYDPTGVIVDDTYMEDELELKGLPLWFSADVSISGSGFSGQEHTVSLNIFHDRPSNGAPWFADGNYSLDLKLAGTIVEPITSDPFTDLSTSNPYTTLYQWTPLSPADNYTIALNITDVTWREVPTYTITATAGLGGTINSNGEIVSSGASVDFFVLPGGSLDFDIYPDPDYVIENVLVDGSSVGTENYYDFIDVQADRTIEALFVYNPAPTVVSVTADPDPATAGVVTVTVVFSEAMDTSISPTVTVMGLQSSTYIVSENTYADDTWTGTFTLLDDNEVATASVHVVGGTDSTGVMMDAASPAGTFEVDTTHIEYTITVTPGAGGIIEPIGPVTVIEGDNQTFTITPNAGNVILDVVINGASKGAISEYTFTDVQADQTITAEFQQGYTYSSTRMIVEGADINLTTASFNGSDPKTYRLGEMVSFVIDAVWDPDGMTGTDLSSLTYNVEVGVFSEYPILSGVTVDFDPAITTPGGTFQFTGSFIQLLIDGEGNWNIKIVVTDASACDYTITASAGEGGSITPSGSVPVTEGDSPTFTITADYGYEITDVLVDSSSEGAISEYTFTNVVAPHTIEAVFTEQLGYTYSSSRITIQYEGLITFAGVASFNGSDPTTYFEGDTVEFIIDLVWDQAGGSSVLSTMQYDVVAAIGGDNEVLTDVIVTFTPAITSGGSFQLTGSFPQPTVSEVPPYNPAGDWIIFINVDAVL